jgi:thiamine phosphate synthase YjbQ (UPF0047 family)
VVYELSSETTRKTRFLDITEAVRDKVAGGAGSVVTIFVPLTTTRIVLQERYSGRPAQAG